MRDPCPLRLASGLYCLGMTCALVALVSSTACGPRTAASSVRPQDPTAAETLHESCSDVSGSSQPLIVDWKAHERADLEEAMSGAVAVVAYDCHMLRLLRDCHADGSYGTLTVSRKEEVVELENADEIRTNLPTFGNKLAAEASAEIQRGSALTLAMFMVGKKRTTVTQVEPTELRGSCSGATHFVRGAFVGAFAMATATRGKVRGAAQLFGPELMAESTSSKRVRHIDGVPGICTQVEPGAGSLPTGCSAILRLDLVPVVPNSKPTQRPKPSIEEALAAQCPHGLVLRAGKCTPATPAGAHACNGDSELECDTECKKGSALSCGKLGLMYTEGIGAKKDPALAVALLKRACDDENATFCNELGALYMNGTGIKRDRTLGISLIRRACSAGAGEGCTSLGVAFLLGNGFQADPSKAEVLFRKGCDAGDSDGCFRAAELFLKGGAGRLPDASQAAGLLVRACDGDNVAACTNLAELYVRGHGVTTDRARAAVLYGKACDAGAVMGCIGLADFHARGEGAERDEAKAAAIYEKLRKYGFEFGDDSPAEALKRLRNPPPTLGKVPGTRESGALQPEVVQAVVRAHFGKLLQCYAAGLKARPNLSGRVSVMSLIDETGETLGAITTKSSITDRGVLDCVANTFREFQFPASTRGPLSIVYPVKFSPTDLRHLKALQDY